MSDTMDDNLDFETLQSELDSKNEIIAALTERLEGTADQLDRLQRSGIKPGSGDAPARPLFSLAQQVEQALESYTELDPEDHFHRIELGIEQILDMLSSGNFASPENSQTEIAESSQTSLEPAAAKSSSNASSKSSGDDDFWEATKARLMGEGAASTESASPEPETTASAGSTPAVETPKDKPFVPAVERPQYEEVELAEMPAPLEEFDDPVVLLEAVTDRDAYIIYLISRLRNAEAAAYPPVDWKELTNAPSGLVAKLVELHDQLEDQLRQAELSVSLERAMLTRERAKLSQVKQHLEKEIKRMGGSFGAGTSSGNGTKEERDRLDRFIELALRSSAEE